MRGVCDVVSFPLFSACSSRSNHHQNYIRGEGPHIWNWKLGELRTWLFRWVLPLLEGRPLLWLVVITPKSTIQHLKCKWKTYWIQWGKFTKYQCVTYVSRREKVYCNFGIFYLSTFTILSWGIFVVVICRWDQSESVTLHYSSSYSSFDLLSLQTF